MSQTKPFDAVANRAGFNSLFRLAHPVPSGWETVGGVEFTGYSCGAPVVRNKCVEGFDDPSPESQHTVPAIPIEQGSRCAAIDEQSVQDHAQRRYQATANWAVSRQLQGDVIGSGQPVLDDATLLGEAASVTDALACLTAQAAEVGFGAEYQVHATPRASVYLDEAGHDVSGVIVGAGYQDGSATTVRLWVTGPVWAGLAPPEVLAAVNKNTNEVEAWARGVGIAFFDPCLNIAVDATAPACPTPA